TRSGEQEASEQPEAVARPEAAAETASEAFAAAERPAQNPGKTPGRADVPENAPPAERTETAVTAGREQAATGPVEPGDEADPARTVGQPGIPDRTDELF